MPHPIPNSEEVQRQAEGLYKQSLRAQVETDDNIGKMILVDVETGDYEIDDVGLSAARRLQARHPDAVLYGIRIGYDAVYALGGTLTRVKQ